MTLPVAAEADDKNSGKDRQQAGDQPANPRTDSPVHEAFHHHLAGKGAGDGAALSAGKQRDGKEGAGGRNAQQRGKRQVGDPNPVGVFAEADDLSAGHGDALSSRKRRQPPERGWRR